MLLEHEGFSFRLSFQVDISAWGKHWFTHWIIFKSKAVFALIVMTTRKLFYLCLLGRTFLFFPEILFNLMQLNKWMARCPNENLFVLNENYKETFADATRNIYYITDQHEIWKLESRDIYFKGRVYIDVFKKFKWNLKEESWMKSSFESLSKDSKLSRCSVNRLH